MRFPVFKMHNRVSILAHMITRLLGTPFIALFMKTYKHSNDYLCEGLLWWDWAVNREACLWQSYLPCFVLLGVRQAGIRATGGKGDL